MLDPTKVLVVKLTDKQVPGIKRLDYFEKAVRAEDIPGPWTLSWADYAGAIHSRKLQELASWTRLDGLELYSGVVDYETSFKISAVELGCHWELALGEVCHSAEVWVNGEPAGCAWTTPFRLDISRQLRPGLNSLRLRVANLAQNRIIEMQQKHLPWQKCRLEENDFQGYCGPLRLDKLTPMKSGLLGPVRLLRYQKL